MNHSERPGWHLKKEIQVTHLISTLTFAAAAVWYVGEIKKDVELLKAGVIAQRERDDRQDKDQLSAAAGLAHRLDRIDEKLDRLIERQTKAKP